MSVSAFFRFQPTNNDVRLNRFSIVLLGARTAVSLQLTEFSKIGNRDAKLFEGYKKQTTDRSICQSLIFERARKPILMNCVLLV